MNLAQIKKRLILTLKAAGVEQAGVFGSYAKGKQKSSDLDLLVRFNGSLLALAELELRLEALIGIIQSQADQRDASSPLGLRRFNFAGFNPLVEATLPVVVACEFAKRNIFAVRYDPLIKKHVLGEEVRLI